MDSLKENHNPIVREEQTHDPVISEKKNHEPVVDNKDSPEPLAVSTSWRKRTGGKAAHSEGSPAVSSPEPEDF